MTISNPGTRKHPYLTSKAFRSRKPEWPKLSLGGFEYTKMYLKSPCWSSRTNGTDVCQFSKKGCSQCELHMIYHISKLGCSKTSFGPCLVNREKTMQSSKLLSFPCVVTCDLWQPVNVCFLETWRRKVWPPFKWTFRPISPRCILLLYFPLRCTFFLFPSHKCAVFPPLTSWDGVMRLKCVLVQRHAGAD